MIRSCLYLPRVIVGAPPPAPMVPVTVPFRRFPETVLAFAMPETVPLAVPEIELELAVRYALSAEKK